MEDIFSMDGLGETLSGRFKHITFIVNFIFIIITSTPQRLGTVA